jgi:hypothetical protein
MNTKEISVNTTEVMHSFRNLCNLPRTTEQTYTVQVQYQVPQNITMEDKIIGPLGPIQFAIVTIGGLGSFLMFTSNTLPDPINKVLGGTGALLTLVLAMGKFNDQPLYSFSKHIISFISSPKVRIWHKVGRAETAVVAPNPSSSVQAEVKVVKHVHKADIAQLAAVLDSRGSLGKSPIISGTSSSKK